MFKKLLIVNEQTPYDDLVMKFASTLKVFGAEEVILAKKNPLKVSAPLTESEELERTREELEHSGIHTRELALDQLPIEEINRLVSADELFESLIVIGAKVSSMGKRIFDSEFAYELIQMPSKPILVVRIHENPDGSPMTLPPAGLSLDSHVLFPTDFSENAHHAFLYLEKMVESGLKHVTLMHVQDIAKISPYLDYRIIEFNQIDRDRLEGLKKRLEEKGPVQVDVVLDVGRPFREIMHTIEKTHVDLVLLGRQGKGFLKDIFIGSTSNNLTRRAPASVLLIPRAERQKTE